MPTGARELVQGPEYPPVYRLLILSLLSPSPHTPPVSSMPPVIAVLASSAAGGGMVGTFHLYGVNALFESPADGGDGRISFVTDPPSDLQLVWDPSFTSADSIEIVLVVVVEDAGEIQDVAVLGQQSNNGSCLILSTALDEFNLLENSFISFKVRGWPVFPFPAPIKRCAARKPSFISPCQKLWIVALRRTE